LSRFAVLKEIYSQIYFVSFCLSSFLLDDNNLNGSLPPELGNLSEFKSLYLSKFLELVFHKSIMEFVLVFVVLLEEESN